jgi:putative addiction module CopG family antidote
VNISLDAKARSFIERMMSRGGFKDAGEVVSEALGLLEEREQHSGSARAGNLSELESALMQAVQSGPASPVSKEDWEQLRKVVDDLSGERA